MIGSFKGDYAWLSNMWPCRIVVDNLEFSSVEAAYQACKCADINDRIHFVGINGYQAKRRGRHIGLRGDWDAIKLNVMQDLVRTKFRDPRLADHLRETNGQELIEGNNWHDTFWGVCNGQGENWLGRILMQVRKELP